MRYTTTEFKNRINDGEQVSSIMVTCFERINRDQVTVANIMEFLDNDLGDLQAVALASNWILHGTSKYCYEDESVEEESFEHSESYAESLG